ncbi:hypothetical protein [Lysobacter sp. N42]|uniref:hypothetical protein n=1 Tax=Lysobacter sp. N42 TaxID=2545719 RepID=UPI0010447CA5|nr:hypothetical protein [Lysobacter sp. N42]TCZ77671.1 hypothetical protein EYQ95_26000 [Lysobacter sp. N42]
MSWKLDELKGWQQALLVFGGLAAIWAFGHLSGNADKVEDRAEQGREASAQEAVAAEQLAADHVDYCVARGVAYFKEIGSYPTLQSAPNAGRPAEAVARERCKRTLTAF